MPLLIFRKLNASGLFLFVCWVLFSATASAQTGSWSALTNPAPHYNEGVMLLLTDGTVICKTGSGGVDHAGSENIGNIWDKLTPVNGSYVNGTWSSIAPMDSPRLYFSSQVLRDGRVYVCGGEYGGGGSYGEIYDPKTNTWSFTGTGGTGVGHPFPNVVSDANSEMLPDGQILQASVDEAGVNWNYLYNPVDNTYTRGPNCLRVDNEAVWVKLPDNSVLFMDNYGQTSERYIPSSNTWVNDATAPVNLFDPYGFEAGAAFLLPNGKVWFIGSLPNTLYYTPSGTSSPGTWTTGPAIPGSLGAPDATAAMLPNGHILLVLSPTPTYYDHFPSPTYYYEFDYTTNTFTAIGAPSFGTTSPSGSFIADMLDLPDGNVLFCDQGTDQYYIYTPGSAPLAAGKPTINTVSRLNCDSFRVTGTLFNGICEGAAYGDDWQMNTNFPIVRLTAGGNIYYATTSNWNRIGAVATGALPDTAIFQLPAGLPVGTYSVSVIANGNPSAPFTINTVFTISPSSAAIIVGATTTFSDTAPTGTWSSGNTGIATVGSTGIVTGTGIGVTQISYSLGAGCYNIATLTVNPSVAGTISGILIACSGGTTVLSDTATGGVWSSGNTGVATVGSTGIVAGISTGTATISYTKSGFSATAVVTIDPQPAPITGSNIVCSGATTSLSDISSGGIWSSTNTANATISSTGIVTGVSPGTTTISYLVPGSCGSIAATLVVTVQVSAVAGTITGAGLITAIGSITLSDAASGGVWSSGNVSVATVGSTGIVAGVSPGTATISYTVTNACGSVSATAVVTVTTCSTIITTIAGTGVAGYSGDGALATTAKLNKPCRMVIDTSGNIYFADQLNHAVRKISTAGIISTVAGNGTAGYSGDGGSATSAQLNTPYAVDIDTAGNLYIADTYNQRIRKVSAAGVITTIAGTGATGYSGDGGLATAAQLNIPGYFRVDRSGNVIFCDNGNQCVRKINNAGIISTIAGTGITGYSGDGGPATSAKLSFPNGIWEDNSGNIYIGDAGNGVIRKVNSSGIISTIAGTGVTGYSGDGGLATAAKLNTPQDIFIDSVGNILFSDTHNHRVRKINTSGVISTIAGTGTAGYSGDGGLAALAMLNDENSVAIDRAGNIYISDALNNRIRKVVNASASPDAGAISGPSNLFVGSTINLTDAAGGGTWSSGSAGVASVGSTGIVTGVGAGTAMITYMVSNICGSAFATKVVTVSSCSAIISTIAGTGSFTYSGDGGLATLAGMATKDVKTDTKGYIYIVDEGNGRIRKVGISGIVTTIVGTGVNGFAGDGGPATAARINNPNRIAFDKIGNLFIADGPNNRIRRVDTNGIITTVAGSGSAAYAGDGGPALSAGISDPYGVAVDTAGNIYIADSYNNRIRKVNTSGIITTIAGTGTVGFSGDGGAATAATLSWPTSVVVDVTGNVYVSDFCNNRIRKIDISGIITSIVGSGAVGTVPGSFTGSYSGDGGAATVATLNGPESLTIDSAGNIFISDDGNNRIRKVNPGGIIFTLAGIGTAGFSGDGGLAAAAKLNNPTGLTMDDAGSILVCDGTNARVRKITNAATSPSVVAISGPAVVSIGSNITLTDAATGGTWSSGSAGIATIGSSSGIVTGIALGTTTITYTASNLCGSSLATLVVTVALPGCASFITTFAGNGTPGYTGDGGLATAAELQQPARIAIDTSGNIYFADLLNSVVRKISPSGIISTVAGTGTAGYSGDGGPATSATLNKPYAAEVDAAGNLYIGDTYNQRIRKVSPAGIITTIAGTGVAGYYGDGGLATAAQLSQPGYLRIDRSGNIIFSDNGNHRVRKINSSGVISTIVGTGVGGYSGDGGPATAAKIWYPQGVYQDTSGNIFISDYNSVIRKVNTSGIISTFAGTGTAGFGGDGGPATAAMINIVQDVFVDSVGNLLFTDTDNNRIRRINTSGIISTIAGNGVAGYSGDGGPAIAAKVNTVNSVAVDRAGNVYISDALNNRIRKITKPITITASTVGGLVLCAGQTATLTATPPSGTWSSSATGIATVGSTTGIVTGVSGGTATISYSVNTLCGVSVATTIVTVNPVLSAGTITGVTIVAVGSTTPLTDAVAGGTWSSSSPGIGSVSATGVVTGVSIGTTTISYAVSNICGTAYATTIVTVSSISGCSPIITTIAGTGFGVHSGDGGLATVAQLCSPDGIAVFGNNLYIGEVCGYSVRKIDLTTGIITTYAGNGAFGFSGDGGPATSAALGSVYDITVDSSGNLFIADAGNYRVRKVSTSGIITTVAGNGVYGFSGDGGPAIAASLSDINGVSPDYHGNVLIPDQRAYCVRRVNASGTINTIAGIPLSSGSVGDGGPATAANFGQLTGVNVDTAGNIFVSDFYNHKVRKINSAGIINAVVGNGVGGYTGDGGPATAAKIYGAVAVYTDVWGNLFFGDSYNNVVRKVNTSGIITTIAGTGVAGHTGDGGLPTGATLHTVGPITGDKNGHIYVCDYGNNCVRKITFPPSVINGPSLLCIETTITLSDSIGGGVWTSGAPGIASVGSATGIVVGISGGTAAIYYTANGCTKSTVVTVNPTVIVGPITGSGVVCIGATTALTDVIAGGTWSSSAPGIATVSSSGLVSGVVGGTATISYTATSCGTSSTALVVTVSPLPAIGAITGIASLCGTGTTQLSDVNSGGTWSSAATGVATVSSTGLVTGISTGTTIISYTITGGCGAATATQVVTVNASSAVAAINGTAVLCSTTTTLLTDATSGGSWSSTATGVATISSTGLITGVAGGTTIISYTISNTCGTSAATRIVTINPSPDAGVITGQLLICVGGSTPLSNAATGGTWSSTATGIATIGSSGLFSGISVGTATISYTVSNSCGTAAATRVVTVSTLPVPGTITGTAVLCATSTTLLSDIVTGGIWSSSATGVASTSSTGLVTGVSGGTATISYAVSNYCGTSFATKVVTINTIPSAGTITGTNLVCVGAATPLTDIVTGGTWSSTASGTATVGTAGLVGGISVGTATIIYAVSNACGTSAATKVVTVNTLPVVSTINGTGTVCQAATISLSDGTGGGTWSSTVTSVAGISSAGVVTGISGGTVTISYAVTNNCGTTAATKVVTVNPLPVSGIITGTPVVCPGATTSLSDITGGGVWSSTATGTASVGSDGVVSGLLTGTTIISYTVTNSCGAAAATQVVVVSVLPDAGTINGTTKVCASSVTSLSDVSGGGVWSSTATSTAVVGSTGMVSGLSAGTSTISYVVTNSCGVATATIVVTVDPLPSAGSIAGIPVLCETSSVSLSDLVAGGIWSTTAGGAATVGSDGSVTGSAAGTSVVSYSVTNNCGTDVATIVITVNPLPQAGIINGPMLLCQSSSASLSDDSPGGVWSSASIGVATIGGAGMLAGVTGGTATISYSVTNSCGTAVATTVVTINPLPDAGVINGPNFVCPGSTIALSDIAPGGVWSSTSSGIATVGTAGDVTGVAAGTAIISYTVTNDCGTAAATVNVTVGSLPDAGAIAGILKLCAGQTTSLSDTVSGGVWSSGTTSVANVNATGILSGLSAGTADISYTVTNICGSVPAIVTVTVSPLPDPGTITGQHHVCIGQNIQLADTAAGVWGSINAGIAIISAGGLINGLQPGVDTVVYSVTDGNGCSASTSFIVTVNPLPAIGPINGITPVCVGAQDMLTDASSGGTWSISNTSLATVDSSSGNVHAVGVGLVTITYTLAADANGCINDTVFELTIISVPNFTIAGAVTNVSCFGGSDGSIAVAINGSDGPFKYQWSNGDSSSQLAGTAAANYSVQVKDVSTQCNLTDSFTVIQPDSLDVTATITSDRCKGGNGEIVLAVSGGTAPYHYTWSNNATTGQIASLLPDIYTVVVTDIKNCEKTERITVDEGPCDNIIVHNGVSPNGDGENDVWVIEGIENYPDNEVQLFDKWGDMVYKQTGYNNTWGGQGSNGAVLPSGSYIYVVKLNARNQSGGKDTLTGTLLLKR